jgi:OPA family glycerol-3-phosphate transporter-like MFS transporter
VSDPSGPDLPDFVARRGWEVISALALGYVGIYLCRKNLSVAMPLLQTEFHASKAEVGTVASVGTLAYAIGKFTNGPIVDAIGGRRGFLISIVLVAIFGAAGALSPGLTVLAILYGLNRFAGAAGWGGMLKLVPSWFPPKRSGTVVGILSLSYVLGGVLATLFARQVVASHGGWRAVMGLPSLITIGIAGVCAVFVRVGPRAQSSPRTNDAPVEAPRAPIAEVLGLFRMPQFLVTCALSFTLTLMRESFNTWSVDFLLQAQGGTSSLATAALQSTGFDLAGFVSILLAGVAYDRVRPSRRRWLMFTSLALLSLLLALLPITAKANPLGGAILVGLAGLLVYGPYSLLAGALAVVNGGPKLAATAAGIIDGVGYIAGALAGITLGRLLDTGGYDLGFGVLAAITGVSALIALGLR